MNKSYYCTNHGPVHSKHDCGSKLIPIVKLRFGETFDYKEQNLSKRKKDTFDSYVNQKYSDREVVYSAAGEKCVVERNGSGSWGWKLTNRNTGAVYYNGHRGKLLESIGLGKVVD